jgi:hypothetical protein
MGPLNPQSPTGPPEIIREPLDKINLFTLHLAVVTDHQGPRVEVTGEAGSIEPPEGSDQEICKAVLGQSGQAFLESLIG